MFGSLLATRHELPQRVSSFFDGSSPALYLKCASSRGSEFLRNMASGSVSLNSLLEVGIIVTAKRGPFVSHPFVIPKNNGTPRMIIDYSHLRGNYRKPFLLLPSTIQMLRARRPMWKGHWLARLDLRDAFYSVPLPKQLWKVSAFQVGDANAPVSCVAYGAVRLCRHPARNS